VKSSRGVDILVLQVELCQIAPNREVSIPARSFYHTFGARVYNSAEGSLPSSYRVNLTTGEAFGKPHLQNVPVA
jgi:hypothetical protein